MFKYWKRIDELHHINRILVAVILGLMLIITSLMLTIITAPKRFEFWLTPQMAANGGLMKPDQVSDEYVQGFVSTLLPLMNTWSNAKDFSKHLHEFHYYFTPNFQEHLLKTSHAYEKAQFFERIQTASLFRFIEPSDIKRLGQNAWEIHLILHLTQRLNTKNPMLISDKVVEYFVRVIKVNESRLLNPFELAIDGYTKPETMLTDLLSGEPNED